MANPAQFKCTHPGCGKKFRSRSAMGQHFRTVHVGGAPKATIDARPVRQYRKRIVGLDMSLAAAVTLPILALGAGVAYAAYYYGGFDAILKVLQ